jgi:hypothetical protein
MVNWFLLGFRKYREGNPQVHTSIPTWHGKMRKNLLLATAVIQQGFEAMAILAISLLGG